MSGEGAAAAAAISDLQGGGAGGAGCLEAGKRRAVAEVDPIWRHSGLSVMG
jgi:hypothetical protein